MKKEYLKLGTTVLCVFCLFFVVTNKKGAKPLSTVVDDPSPYGINTHNLPIGSGGSAAMALAKQAGIKWIRIDLWWKAVEKQSGVFTWTDIDTIVNYAMNNSFSILANIAYTPQFYAGGDTGKYLPAAYLPKWDIFVSNVVDRYKNSIKYWEIWNEPNIDKYWDVRDTDGYSGGSCGGAAYDKKVGGYVQVLLIAAQRIKAVDPTARVCAPGFLGGENINTSWQNWIRPVLCMRGGLIDVITHHQYNDYVNDVCAKLDQLRSLIVGYGYGSKPFWLTETGWNSIEWGECNQSSNLQGIMWAMGQRSWWNKTFWYMLRDVSTDPVKWGIIKENNAIKFAWCGYNEFIRKRKTPDLYAPANEAVLHTSTPTLQWKNLVCKGQMPPCSHLFQFSWYDIEIRNAGTNVVVLLDSIYHDGDIVSYTVPPGVLTTTRYKWRVRCFDETIHPPAAGKAYPWSAARYFTVS